MEMAVASITNNTCKAELPNVAACSLLEPGGGTDIAANVDLNHPFRGHMGQCQQI